MTIEQLREQRAALHARMSAVVDAANGRALTQDEQTNYDGLRAEFDAASAALDTALVGQRLRLEASASVELPGDAAPVSLGQHVVNEIGERITAAGGHMSPGTTLSAPEFTNAAGDTQVTTGSGLAPLLTELDRSIVPGNRRRLTIADLLGQGTLTGSAITYFVEQAIEGGFTTVGENAQKPQLHVLDPIAVTEVLKKIAGYIKLSTEMLEDLPFLVSEINTRLLYELDLFEENQLLNGAGTGTTMRGLLQRTGIQALGAVGDPAAANADLLFRGITSVSTATGLDADGIIMNPVDYQKLRLSKDGNGQYFGGGFFAGQYGNGGIVEQPPLWGQRTVVTPAIAAGTALVGAFQASTTLYRKGGVRVEVTNADGNDATNNRVAVIAEKRAALAVRQPGALVKITLGAA